MIPLIKLFSLALYTCRLMAQHGAKPDGRFNLCTFCTGNTSSYNMTLVRFKGYKGASVSGSRSDSAQVRTSAYHYDVNSQGSRLGCRDNKPHG